MSLSNAQYLPSETISHTASLVCKEWLHFVHYFINETRLLPLVPNLRSLTTEQWNQVLWTHYSDWISEGCAPPRILSQVSDRVSFVVLLVMFHLTQR